MPTPHHLYTHNEHQKSRPQRTSVGVEKCLPCPTDFVLSTRSENSRNKPPPNLLRVLFPLLSKHLSHLFILRDAPPGRTTPPPGPPSRPDCCHSQPSPSTISYVLHNPQLDERRPCRNMSDGHTKYQEQGTGIGRVPNDGIRTGSHEEVIFLDCECEGEEFAECGEASVTDVGTE